MTPMTGCSGLATDFPLGSSVRPMVPAARSGISAGGQLCWWAAQLESRPRSYLAELGARALLEDAVHVDVHLLVVEAGQTRDLLRLGQRGAVDPDEVFVHCRAGVHRPVACGPLVRALSLRVGGAQQVHPDVREREVVAGGQAGLEQDARLAAVCDGDPVDLDPDVPRAGQDVDPGIGVARVDVDRLLPPQPPRPSGGSGAA